MVYQTTQIKVDFTVTFSIPQEKPQGRKLSTNFTSKYHSVFLLLSFGHPRMPILFSKIQLQEKLLFEDSWCGLERQLCFPSEVVFGLWCL